MAKKSRAGNSYKTQYKTYKSQNRFQKNKKAKLEKHCLTHPNDEVAMATLEAGTWDYKRNRRSSGHICKVDKSHVFKNPQVSSPLSAGEQLVILGIINEQKYRKSIRFGKQGILRR